ncbi:MAG TPA: malectin domain-containing carbohydrate-binding protein [bacterium]|nr:malectin domain-containing carbohydrate-binding protein [bacterium]
MTINPSTTYQTISGFGAASVWDSIATLRGLAVTLWHDDSGSPPASQANGQVGLSINRILIDESGNANWGTEAAAATLALSQNPNMRIFGTSWSPPAKWKNNNNTSGNNTGNDNGNPGGNSNQMNHTYWSNYAAYQTSWATAMKNTYGFTPYALSVQNEPDYDTNYQSCLWSASDFDTYIKTYLGPALATAGFNPIIMMPESFADNLNLSATTMGDSAAATFVKAIGMHLYGGGPSTVPASYSTVAGHTVESWETEISDFASNDYSITSGLKYANQIHNCIVDHNFNAYVYWWILNLNTDNEGLYGPSSSTTPTKRLFALGNFSKFIRPGFNRISCTEVPTAGVSVSAYYSSANNKVVVVAINNNGSAKSLPITFSGLTVTTVYPWLTDASNNLVQQSSVAVSGGGFTYNLPSQSIVTFVASTTGGTPVPTSTPTKTPTPIVQSTWRVNAGGPAYTDTLGNLWAADENYSGGSTVASGGTITGTSDSTLYDTQRYGGTFSYSFNVPAGSYQVTLKLAETYSGDFSNGARVFSVSINGTTVTSNLDIYSQVGSNAADDQVYNNVSPSGGVITITLTSTGGTDANAVLEALQIIPMPATSTPTRTSTPTSTATSTATRTNSPTSTATSSATSTPTRTNTPVPPTATPTSTATRTDTPVPPTATPTSTASSTATKTNSPTSTSSFTATATPSSTPTKTSTPTSSATSTSTSSFTATSTLTSTPSSTSTRTFTPTVTPSPTNTDLITPTPTSTGTSTFTFTHTATSTASGTPTGTATRTFTWTSTPTSTSTATDSSTSTATSTPSLTSTQTLTPTVTLTPTNTALITPTPTSTGTSTFTFTSTGTSTFTRTATPTLSSTPTSTNTASATSTATSTPVNTLTPTPTPTSTGTFTFTPTFTLTPTKTNSPTSTATRTFTPTVTFTYTPTWTFTPTNSPTSTFSPTATATSTSTPVGNTTVILYPNPDPGTVVNILPPAFSGMKTVHIQIFTASFRKVVDIDRTLPGGVPVTLDLKDAWGHPLANGLYYVFVTVDGKRSLAKLLVLH